MALPGIPDGAAALTADEQAYEAYIQQIVDSVPPITDEQRATVTALLQPTAIPAAS